MSYWTINGIETDGLIGAQTGIRPGNASDHAFLFRPRPEWDDPTDDHITRYEEVRKLTVHAGNYHLYETLDNRWFWHETGPVSPLVEIDPPEDDRTARRIWGLISDYDDSTTLEDKRCALSLSIDIISIGDEYPDESTIRDDRELAGL